MTCPKCRGEMRQFERSGVTVDQCLECRGIFLDRGELERLIDAEQAWQGRQQPSHGGGYPQQPSYGGGYPQQPHQQPYPQAHGGHGGYGHYGHHKKHRRHHRESFFGELFD
ncbi:zf-TFIIB domain-containing protein [Dactylosporangium sp. CA-233914]|uniref:TFIIB-type zinc ribbon-containing protein n=1 Tax=Dactylosporangium sp. CA-233914 TaxID=3239934 RepID=UPI003D8EEC69